ncbi:MAG: metal-dependent transcriptional regulator [Deltaproteobacteria bacterium]|nr:metal-dependent transcriptional regulator [Deltaproteobacteria bacterium]
MDVEATITTLSSSLEDYLETIFELVRDQRVARIRDIAKARNVKPGSVSPAMKRLMELGLVTYERREYITLTPAGERAARRVYAKHQLLNRFLNSVLGVDPIIAAQDACAMEHDLSDASMDALTRFIEFVEACPEGATLLDRFHHCSLVHRDDATMPPCEGHDCRGTGLRQAAAEHTLSDLAVGEHGRVLQVLGQGAIRQRLLDMGLLPGALVTLERRAPLGEPLWIRLQGFQLSLRSEEARAIVLAAPHDEAD